MPDQRGTVATIMITVREGKAEIQLTSHLGLKVVIEKALRFLDDRSKHDNTVASLFSYKDWEVIRKSRISHPNSPITFLGSISYISRRQLLQEFVRSKLHGCIGGHSNDVYCHTKVKALDAMCLISLLYAIPVSLEFGGRAATPL